VKSTTLDVSVVIPGLPIAIPDPFAIGRRR
jgi:hypothetical protein